MAAEDSSNLSATTLGLAGLTYGPGGVADEAGQTLTYAVTAIPPAITLWLADGTTPVSCGSTLTLVAAARAELPHRRRCERQRQRSSGRCATTAAPRRGVDTLAESLAITITPVNDAPVLRTSSGTLAYTENQPATPVDPALTLGDIDSATLASARVTISVNFAAGQDRLVFTDQNGISGSFDAATGVLSLSGVATVANYEAALRSVGYRNTSDDPSTLTRTVSFTVNDGALGSNPATRSIVITAGQRCAGCHSQCRRCRLHRKPARRCRSTRR